MEYNKKKPTVLIAGASGYLGGYVLRCAIEKGYNVRVLVRSQKQKDQFLKLTSDVVIGQVIDSSTLAKIFFGVDIVFSSVGITRQKDGLTYLDVDYQGNLNLLNGAIHNDVKKFIYTSVFNPEALKGVEIIDAKELFVNKLENSPIDYSVIRPTGFFSDISEVLKMAQKGSVYLFGNGEYKVNPISGRDLAEVCCNSFSSNEKVVNVGGPDVYSGKEISKIAFQVLGKKERIIFIPLWFINAIVFILKLISNSKFYGPIEFFSKATTVDMIAPKYGKDNLRDFFRSLIKS